MDTHLARLGKPIADVGMLCDVCAASPSRLSRDGDPISFACPKEIGERKRHPAAAYFLCVFRPFREACVTRPSRRHISSPAAELERYAPLFPKWSHMLGAAKGAQTHLKLQFAPLHH